MRNITTAILVGSGLVLSACSGDKQVNRSVNSVHQPVVERSQYVIDLNVAGGALAAGETTRLDQWMGVLEVGYGDGVAIDYGNAFEMPGVKRDVASLAARRGLLLADYAPITSQPFVPGTVRIVVSRSVAYVPGCPDWTQNSAADYTNGLHSNYGCATNANLASMIADPEDLVRGKKGEPSTRTGVDAVKQYREAGPGYGTGDLSGGVAEMSGGSQ